MKHFALAAASALALVVAASPAAAATIYNNGAPNSINGSEMSIWVQAETFSLAAADTIRSVSFQALTFDSVTDASLQYWVFSNAGGTPGTILENGAARNLTFTANGDAADYPAYDVSFNLASGFAAAAGTSYFLGMRIAGISDVYWGTTNPNATPTSRESQNGTFDNWRDNRMELSFALANTAVGAVPEPATWGLMLLGMGMVGGSLRTRRRSVSFPAA